MKHGLKKNIMMVSLANAIYIVIVGLTNFILPKYCSIETYANIKTYTLYLTTYSSFLTFGYIQGVYLQYGGKEIEKINPHQFASAFYTFVILEIPIILTTLAIGYFYQNNLIALLSIGFFAVNITEYFKSVYQATGEFRLYSVALNVSRIATFLVYLLLIFVLKSDNDIIYILTPIAIALLVIIFLTINLQKKIQFIEFVNFSIDEFKINIKNGFSLMLGAFASSLFISMDKWFVKIFFSNSTFALFSFSVSIENLISSFMSPISISMYSYLCKNDSLQNTIRIKNAILVYCFVVISSAFVCKFIIETFLPQYQKANITIFILFAAQIFFGIVKSIYINLYKVRRKQTYYLLQTFIMTILSVFTNGIFYFLFKNMNAIALSTLLISFTWLIVCEFENKDIMFNKKEYITIILITSSFLFTGIFMGATYGLLLYLFSSFVVLRIFIPETLFYVMDLCFNAIKKRAL